MNKKTIVIILVLIVVIGAGLGLILSKSSSNKPKLKTTTVTRGDIEAIVVTTGTLDPVTMVEVGSEISGVIKSIAVDYNSHVQKGQVLAELDKASFEDAMKENEANYRVAQAALDKAKVALDEAKKSYDRAMDLFKKNMISAEDKEAADEQYQSAKDDVKVAQEGVKEAKSALDSSQVDLEHTNIRTPIDGVVFSRDVNIGQAVASKFQTPVLFKIADDLSKMRVECAVDEADVGKVKEGQKVRFAVEAFPEDTFNGRVVQIRDEPDTSENVVTYTTIVEVSDPETKLMPGMTATVSIVTAEARNVLKIPNGALRYRPAGAPPRPSDKPTDKPGLKQAGGKKIPFVWVQGPNHKLTPVLITTGITDNVYTEVVSGDLKEADIVVTG
jgi:HlyD family secretion protein